MGIVITGIDDKSPLRDLLALQKEHPYLELAVLDGLKAGNQRAASIEITKTLEHFSPKWAVHLCNKCWTDFTIPFNWHPNRVQINWEVDDFRQIDEWANIGNFDVRLQDANWYPFYSLFNLDTKHIDFLDDLSRGTGTVLNPLLVNKDKRYNYAGGINPTNVTLVLKMLEEVTEHINWDIDIESGVRTDNWLDLKKVINVVEAYANWRG